MNRNKSLPLIFSFKNQNLCTKCLHIPNSYLSPHIEKLKLPIMCKNVGKSSIIRFLRVFFSTIDKRLRFSGPTSLMASTTLNLARQNVCIYAAKQWQTRMHVTSSQVLRRRVNIINFYQHSYRTELIMCHRNILDCTTHRLTETLTRVLCHTHTHNIV